MELLIILAIIVLGIKTHPKTKQRIPQNKETIKEEKDIPIAGNYQKRWILSNNEKEAYRKLKVLCDKTGLLLMTKVRLLDLVEPIPGIKRYKTYLYKVQSKHVDFVICDEQMIVRCIIELDDSTHLQPERIARDKFVDEVLHSVGYPIIHTWAITDQTWNDILKITGKEFQRPKTSQS